MPVIEPGLRAEAIALADSLGDPRVTDIFTACFDNTIETTVRTLSDGTTFILTGDIPAMWLRDSVAQVRPYLLFAARSPHLRATIEGLLARQAEFILLDPYANAFNAEPNGAGHDDITDRSPWVWERKYEIDSLAYPMQLAMLYHQATGSVSWCTDRFLAAVDAILLTWETELDHEQESAYRFERPDPLAPSDTLVRDGHGPLSAPTGMTWAGFRPSDDACTYSFNIPGNAFATVALTFIEQISQDIAPDERRAQRARTLRQSLSAGIAAHGTMTVGGADVLAYEVDGLGSTLFMDDANVPSLLSLPMLGYCEADDPQYLATRDVVLSAHNPYYYEGTAAQGVGSPHTPARSIWPIALCVQGITSTDPDERRTILETLRDCDAGTSLMHESFDADDPHTYSREWFSWANSMFCEFVLDLAGRSVTNELVRPATKEAIRP